MGDSPHKPLPKLRTFQLDQAHARGEAVVPPVEKKSETPAATPVPKITVTASKKPDLPPAPPKETTPPVPPSFHELKKQAHKKIEHIVAEETKPATKTITVRDKTAAPLPRSFSAEATVITSGKKSDFRLFPSIISAVTSWFSSFKSSQEPAKYTVSTVERRKGVIQKATTNSGAIFTATGDSLKQEITKKRDNPPAEPEKLHLTWSPQTEVGFPLLEEPERPLLVGTKPSVVVEYKKRTVTAPEIVEPRPLPDTYQEPTLPEQLEKEPAYDLTVDSPYVSTTDISIPTKESLPTPTPAPQFIVPPVPTFEIPSAPPVPPVLPTPITPQPAVPFSITKPGTSIPNKPNPKSSYLRRGLNRLFRFNTNVATVIVVGSLISFVLMFMVVRTFINMIVPAPGAESDTLSLAEPLSPAARVVDVAVSSVSLEALRSTLQGEPRPANSVVEFRILEASGETVSGNRLWNMFAFSTDPNLSRSITELRPGYAAGEQILIAKVTNVQTVFGALLSWEPDMERELSSVFDDLTPTGRQFTDETISGTDVRILKDGETVVLLYGFVTENTLVITTSRTAYEAAAGM